MSANSGHVDQVLSGIRRLLSDPRIYDALQSALGVHNARRFVCENYIDASDGDVVIDVGCGTAELLRHLPYGCNYYGVDLSPAYLDAASKRYMSRGRCHFICADLGSMAAEDLPPCDRAIAYGVLHHLNDEAAKRILAGLHARLAPRGTMVTVDPVFEDEQSFVARGLISRDRGQHVRTADGYISLIPDSFERKSVTIRRDLLRVPYSLAIMHCHKAAA